VSYDKLLSQEHQELFEIKSLVIVYSLLNDARYFTFYSAE